jgi:hypothetical protein
VKRCGSCEEVKPLDQFHRAAKGTFGRQGICAACGIRRAREWREAHPGYTSQRAAAGYWHSYRWNRLFQRYRLTRKDYEELLSKQNGVCAVCAGNNNGKHLFVDHDHGTGIIRGLLCGGCNHAIGWVERDGWLDAARSYLSLAGL